ncbi:hypothetical protein F4780DRAFT_445767 [Xylariomycetidae sp. FL0641]|nr:hypothetical protein F4780DRAFT_445767 [Xylariomycetidae sp. FL0641]
MSLTSRVCDRCIRKKVKCDLQRPNCSRCSEVGSLCTYSTERRKPGPVRGTRRQRHAPLMADQGSGASLQSSQEPRNESPASASGSGSLSNSMQSQSPMANVLAPGLTPQLSSSIAVPDFNQLQPNLTPYGPIPLSSQFPDAYPGYHVEPSQEREILECFFDEVHTAVMLFQKQRFMQMYEAGAIQRDLIVTIVTITAKVLGPISYWRDEDVNLCMDGLLKAAPSEDNLSDSQASLDRIRQECLLAYYDFHQFPGPRSWTRIGRLTRKAYSLGLNQIENPGLCSAFNAAITTEDEIEDWRYVWWCVYCFDSYSNITSGAPLVIELEGINTALVRRSYAEDIAAPFSMPKLQLPDDIDHLWSTTQEVLSSGCIVNYNIHMVTTTILREAGSLFRLRTEGKRLPSRTANLKSAFTPLRLALPPRYLTPARNVLRAETSADHHMRLTNILHLHMVRIVILMPPDIRNDESGWMDKWQQILEACQDVVQVIEQWNNHFSPRVDPAICFIIFFALCLLNLHRRSMQDTSGPLLANLRQGENVLRIFLEHFSSIWTLPKFLLEQYRKTPTEVPVNYHEVDSILSNMRTPLHPKNPKNTQSVTTMPLDNTDLYANLGAGVNFADIWSFNPYEGNI